MQRIIAFLNKYKIFNSEKCFLVGFSGGFDSMCLLDILTKLSKEHHYKIIAVHLNHNWRGDESDKEEENCKKFCEEHDLTFYSERLPDSIKKSETAAREARQRFFKKCCEKFNAEGIFLAHNKSDNTETVIFRIAHGTGVKGLCGITEYSQIFGYKIYRPLLTWSRQDVEEYCKTHNLTPNNDSSNSDTKYNRNFLRHKVIKDLKQINEDIDSAVMRLSEIAQSEQNIINEYLNKIRAKIEIDNKIKTGSFLNLSYDVQKKFIHEFFIKSNLEYDAKKIIEVLLFIQENSNLKSGKTLSLTDNLWLFVNEKYFALINKADKNYDELRIEGEGEYIFQNKIFEIKKIENTPEKFPLETENYAYANLTFPLYLRTRRDGDIINPFGMQGSMKLKKYFINKNIEQYIRDKIVLLCNEREVLWIPGTGLSEKIRVKKTPLYLVSMKER